LHNGRCSVRRTAHHAIPAEAQGEPHHVEANEIQRPRAAHHGEEHRRQMALPRDIQGYSSRLIMRSICALCPNAMATTF